MLGCGGEGDEHVHILGRGSSTCGWGGRAPVGLGRERGGGLKTLREVEGRASATPNNFDLGRSGPVSPCSQVLHLPSGVPPQPVPHKAFPSVRVLRPLGFKCSLSPAGPSQLKGGGGGGALLQTIFRWRRGWAPAFLTVPRCHTSHARMWPPPQSPESRERPRALWNLPLGQWACQRSS